MKRVVHHEKKRLAEMSNVHSWEYYEPVGATQPIIDRAAPFLGTHVAKPKETPLCNLYTTMLGAMGVEVDSFGDSTGTIKELLPA